MNEHFDRRRDQLTEAEKARVWKNLERHARGEELEPLRSDDPAHGSDADGSSARRRWRSWWLAPIGAAAVAAVLLVILLSDGPEPQIRIQPPEADTGAMETKEQAVPQTSMLDSEPESESESEPEPEPETAAPGGRQATVPVPSPSAASRQAAEARPEAPALSRVDVAAKNAPQDPRPVLAEATAPAGSRTSRIELFRGGEDGAVTGRVSDAAGRPLEYANVVLVATQFAAATGPTGEFAIRGVPEGLYTLRVLMMGYQTVTAESVSVSTDDGVLIAATLDSHPVDTIAELQIVATKEVLETKRTDTAHSMTSKDMESLPADEIADRIGLKAGVIVKGDAIHFRGGPAGEAQYQVDGVQVRDPLGRGEAGVASAGKHRDTATNQSAPTGAPSEARRRGAITLLESDSDAGTALRNDEPYDAMYFESEGVNPFIDTRDDAQSTFAVDVDRASYTITREYLGRGYLPPREAIRVEEFVNAFDPGYPEFTEPDFRIFVDGSPAPFRPNHQLVRVGIQGRSIDAEDRKPTDLVFVVDVSGSMDREDRLQTVKRALGLLLDELHPSDRVALVVYETQSRVVLRPTSVEDRAIIQSHIDALSPSGSTNAEEGLRIGYELAREMRREGRQARLLLCSDGVANVGRTGPESILETVRRESDRGIYLSTIGFGMGNYNDVLMEQLADNGDGAAYYVDSIEEAERVFVSELSGTLQTIGRDAKIQVEFDPAVVERYRLLGYENRDVADRDFRNDAVDAGELGAGHTVTALYEVRLADDAPRNRRLGVVRFRWERPREDGGWSSGPGEVREIERPIEPADIATSVSRASAHLRMAAAAAELAEILRGSFWAKEHSIDGALELSLIHI